MTANKNFELLKIEGDPIEKVLCEYSAELSPIIYTYADVWADFIYPNRIHDGSVVKEEWMPFAGSHYTAFIRYFHSYEAKRQIEDISKKIMNGDNSAKLLLDAHLATATFWENLGSCVDNLSLSLEKAPYVEFDVKGEEQEGKKGRDDLKKDYPALSEAYDRRTQFIHSRLVPQAIDEGALILNVKLFLSKNTEWPSKNGVEQDFVETVHSNFWNEFNTELHSAWNHLYNWMKNKAPRQKHSSEGAALKSNKRKESDHISPSDIPASGTAFNPIWLNSPPSGEP